MYIVLVVFGSYVYKVIHKEGADKCSRSTQTIY